MGKAVLKIWLRENRNDMLLEHLGKKHPSSLVLGIGDIYAKIGGVRTEQEKILEEDAGEGLF